MRQIRVLLRNAQLGVGTGQLFKSHVIIGTVQHEAAELIVFFVTEFVLEEGGEPSVPWHHGLVIGGFRGGGFGRGCADVGTADVLEGRVGGLLFGHVAEDEGGAYHPDECGLDLKERVLIQF